MSPFTLALIDNGSNSDDTYIKNNAYKLFFLTVPALILGVKSVGLPLLLIKLRTLYGGCFCRFTDTLNDMADWLEIVAMEATGVYWIPLFELFDRRGFKAQAGLAVPPLRLKI